MQQCLCAHSSREKEGALWSFELYGNLQWECSSWGIRVGILKGRSGFSPLTFPHHTADLVEKSSPFPSPKFSSLNFKGISLAICRFTNLPVCFFLRTWAWWHGCVGTFSCCHDLLTLFLWLRKQHCVGSVPWSKSSFTWVAKGWVNEQRGPGGWSLTVPFKDIPSAIWSHPSKSYFPKLHPLSAMSPGTKLFGTWVFQEALGLKLKLTIMFCFNERELFFCPLTDILFCVFPVSILLLNIFERWLQRSEFSPTLGLSATSAPLSNAVGITHVTWFYCSSVCFILCYWPLVVRWTLDWNISGCGGLSSQSSIPSLALRG